MKKLSFYDLRKAARAAQNSLFSSGSSPFELQLRAATTNDAWGPSTKELQELVEISTTEPIPSLPQQVEIIFERLAKYLNPEKVIGDRQHRSDSLTSSIYNLAVNYVNQGSEWRIVYKCLKVLEFLIVNSPKSEEIVTYITSNQPYLEQTTAKYKRLMTELEVEFKAHDIVPTAKLKEMESMRSVMNLSVEVFKLFKDKEYRKLQISKSSKLSDQLEYSNGNNVFLQKASDAPRDKTLKTKELDRHKLRVSNIKQEVRNEINHLGVSMKKEIDCEFDEADDYGNFDQIGESVMDSTDDEFHYSDFELNGGTSKLENFHIGDDDEDDHEVKEISKNAKISQNNDNQTDVDNNADNNVSSLTTKNEVNAYKNLSIVTNGQATKHPGNKVQNIMINGVAINENESDDDFGDFEKSPVIPEFSTFNDSNSSKHSNSLSPADDGSLQIPTKVLSLSRSISMNSTITNNSVPTTVASEPMDSKKA